MELEYVVVQYEEGGYSTDLLKFTIPEVAIDVARQYKDKFTYRGMTFKVEVRYA